MNLRLQISFFFSAVMTLQITGFAQDSTFKFSIDTNFLINSATSTTLKFERPFDFIYHKLDNDSYQLYKKYIYLIKQTPTEKNHKGYFELAEALWHIKKTSLSEKMFLNIVNSKIKPYNFTEFHSSGTLYGYGSFTSNYKNAACVYLSKIYIEKKKFQSALNFLDQAVKTYKVYYTCGTGHNQQQNEYDFLYAACFEGLGYNKKNIDNLLPSFFDWNNKILTDAIKKTYSKTQIEKYLLKAERSINCSVDSFQSEYYTVQNYNEPNEVTDTIRYYGGKGSIVLFNRKINLPHPYLENGEHLTREYYVKLFKESSFYATLSNKREDE